MSRAFTKEDDAGEDLPERPVPAGPNYVTPLGLKLLQTAAEELVEQRKKTTPESGEWAGIDRDLRYLDARLGSAIVVPPGSGNEVRFGAKVTLEDEKGKKRVLKIVGEDEARTDSSFLPWTAPLTQAMLGKKLGENFSWKGTEGAVQYKISAVEYAKDANQ
jgi:transcription elongation factor GreB